MKSKYSYKENDFECFDISNEEGEVSTYIATADTAEKADFLAKAANYFSEHKYGEKPEEVKAIEDLNDINYNSNEGVLLFAALLHLTMVKKKTALEIIELLNYTANKYDRWQDLNGNRAVLIPVTEGQDAGQWRFILKAGNGEIIGQGEHYTRKESAIDTLERNFPNFNIVEKED